MVLTLLHPPTEEPVSLERAKEYLRLEKDDEDSLVLDLMIAAREQLERQWDIAFLTQTWRLQDSFFPTRRYYLQKYPIASVKSVLLEKESGVINTVTANDYTLSGGIRNYLQVKNKGAYASDYKKITIEFYAGFDTASKIPLPLQQAICMLTAHNYEYRNIIDNINHYSVPVSIERLMQPFREVRL